jgi:2-aminoadipate transaminase
MNWQERYAGRMSSLAPSVAVSELLKLAEKPDVISFAGGLPDPQIFPVNEIHDTLSRVLTDDGQAALNYGPGPGYTALRDWIAERMVTREKVTVSRENILVSSGGVEALHLACLTLLEAGDTIIVGAPTYLVALHVFRAHQLNIVSIDLDEGGLDTDALEVRLRELADKGVKPKLVYTIPSFQNPSGLTMGEQRRRELVDICERFDLLIVEDHAYADLRYEGEPVTALMAMAPHRVIFIQTFSKIFAPGVRLGWTTADADLIRHMALCKVGTDTCSNTLCQRLVYEYGRRGGIDRQVSEAVSLYRRKRDLLLSALEEHLGNRVAWTRPAGGFYVWLTLPEQIHSEELLRKAIETEKTAFVAGPPFFADGSGARHLRLSFSFVSENDIEEGVKRLAKTMDRLT